jgi:O-antigen/teichoic acid export membrane protein
MKDLKQKAIRGGFAKVCSQATSFLIRIGSLMIMARILDPKDYGLVGMVTAVIGVFNVFRDFGLSGAAVQRANVTEKQVSTLFWINLLVGSILGLLSVAMAPFVARFYHEPRLLGVTVALATGFLFNAAGVQHSAMLERQMRFTALSLIDITSLLVSAGIGISMATRGFGYWALVASTITAPLTYTICVWVITAWVPGRPHKQVGIRSMMRFGGTLTMNGLVMYISSNFEKVLLGRFWGVDAVGIYGRAYQLINIPTDNLNLAAGGVAFSALSRLQQDATRFRSYFLKGYSLILSLTVPITCTCALFADDMILVFLGPKWKSAVLVFRLLAPTTLAFAILNPLGWLLSSLGLVGRGLKIALVLGPLMITSYVIGLSHGPTGVALAYSTIMTLCAVPILAWAVHGTAVSARDALVVIGRPLFSGVVAAGLGFGSQFLYGPLLPALPRLVVGVSIVFSVYLVILLYVMGQKPFYMDLLRGLKDPSTVEKPLLASA